MLDCGKISAIYKTFAEKALDLLTSPSTARLWIDEDRRTIAALLEHGYPLYAFMDSHLLEDAANAACHEHRIFREDARQFIDFLIGL